MYKVNIATIMSAVLLPVQAYAVQSVENFELRTGEDLVDLCAVLENDPMAEAARNFCYGFLSGANAYHQAVNAGKDDHPLYCLPSGEQKLSRAEAAQLYVDWSKGNSQYLNEAPVDNLMRFAIATWPCK